MAVNRFAVVAQQDDIDNSIQLPTEALFQAGAMIQARGDAGRAQNEAIRKLLDIKVRQDSEKDLRDYSAIQSEYDNQLTNILADVKNNPADVSYREKADRLYDNIKKDVTNGRLGALSTNYNLHEAWNKDVNEFKGEYQLYNDDRFFNLHEKFYKGAINDDGTFNIPKSGAIHEFTNEGEEVSKLITGINAEAYGAGAYLGTGEDGNMYVFKENGERITNEKIEGAFNLINNSATHNQIKRRGEALERLGQFEGETVNVRDKNGKLKKVPLTKETYVQSELNNLLGGAKDKFRSSKMTRDMDASQFALQDAKFKQENPYIRFEGDGEIFQGNRPKSTSEMTETLNNYQKSIDDNTKYLQQIQSNPATNPSEIRRVKDQILLDNSMKEMMNGVYEKALKETNTKTLPEDDKLFQQYGKWNPFDDKQVLSKAKELGINKDDYDGMFTTEYELTNKLRTAISKKLGIEGTVTDESTLFKLGKAYERTNTNADKWLKENADKYAITPKLVTVNSKNNPKLNESIAEFYNNNATNTTVFKNGIAIEDGKLPANVQINSITKTPIGAAGYLFSGTEQVIDPETGKPTGEKNTYYIKFANSNIPSVVGKEMALDSRPKGVDNKGNLIFEDEDTKSRYKAGLNMYQPTYGPQIADIKVHESKDIIGNNKNIVNVTKVPSNTDGFKYILKGSDPYTGEIRTGEVSNEFDAIDFITKLEKANTK